jgi:hypothetical protein
VLFVVLWSEECCSEDWLIPERACLDLHPALPFQESFPACWELFLESVR